MRNPMATDLRNCSGKGEGEVLKPVWVVSSNNILEKGASP
jgi:hypothetical protein